MSHNIIGLDLGRYAVKAVEIRLGIRGVEIVGFDKENVPLDSSGRSRSEDVQFAAGKIIGRIAEESDTVHCAASGEKASLRLVTLPKNVGRRLEQVLKFELDETLPYSIDDAVFDYIEVSRSDAEIGLLAAVVRHDDVAGLIAGLAEHEVNPREVGVVGLSYATLTEHPWKELEEKEVTAIIDFGHQRTDVFIFGDTVPTTRTLLRGGRDLTEKIGEKWKLSFDDAEQYKRRDGLFGEVGQELKLSLRAMLREIKQTLKGHEAAGGRRVQKVVLVGGGARLKGLPEYLSDELGLTTEVYENPVEELGSASAEPDTAQACTLAYALALREAVPRAERVNLRRGDLVFKGDFEYLKKRIWWVAAAFLTVLTAWIFSNYAEYSILKEHQALLTERLEKVSKATFGKPLITRELIEEELVSQQAEKAPIPERDAFDVVVELSKLIPESVVHDVELLEIKPKRITLKGIVDPELQQEGAEGDGQDTDRSYDTQLSPVDLVKQELEKFPECFQAIRVGKVTAVGERRKYQMDIDSKCP